MATVMIVVLSISQLEQPHSLYLAEDVTEEEGECGIFTHPSIFNCSYLQFSSIEYTHMCKCYGFHCNHIGKGLI